MTAPLDRAVDALVVGLPILHWIFSRNQTLLHTAAAACVVQFYREGVNIHSLPSWIAVALFNIGRTSGFVIVVELLAFLLIAFTRVTRRFLPIPVFPPPHFAAHVGVRHIFWDGVDGKHRGADVFYPATKAEGERHFVTGKHGRQFLKLLFHTQNKPFWFTFLLNHLTRVTSNSYENAPMVIRSNGGGHPLVVFSPGLFGSPEIYTYFCEALASMGMVVACVRHTDKSSNFIDAKGSVRHAFAEMPFEDERRSIQVEERVADVLDLVRHLEQTNKDMWNNQLDLKKIAIAGHSFGGSTVFRALTSTDRFHCGIVLDGWFWPIAKFPFPPAPAFEKTSCLFLLSPLWQPPKGLERIKRMCRMSKTWRPYFIKNSTHHAYDDLPLWFGTWISQRIGMQHRDLDHIKAAMLVVETAFDFLTQTLPQSQPITYLPAAEPQELEEISLEQTPPSSPRIQSKI